MALQHSTGFRNALADLFESHVGTSAVLKVFTGAQPANCAAANSGTELASLTLPSDWMAAASGGAKAMAGAWQDAAANNNGTAGHFRIYASDGTTCHHQGSVTVTGGGGDLTVDDVVFATGQEFNITGFTITAPGA